MADAKSVIEIDVVDDAFKEFTSLFAKYKSSLDDMPAPWKKVNTEITSSSSAFKKFTDISKDASEQMKKATTFQDKFKISASASGKQMHIIAQGAGKVAKSISSITLNLLKWAGLTGVFSGLLGGAGLFGLDKLAQSASESRRSAQGLGITPGEHEAAKISYGRAVDVDPLLAKINEMRNDYRQLYKFQQLGLKPGDITPDQSSADILPKVLEALKTQYEKGGKNAQYAEAHGLTQFADVTDLTRLTQFSREELAGLKASYDQRKKDLAIGDGVQRKWQDLLSILDTSGGKIKNILIDKLSVVGPLGDLSTAFAKAIGVFLDSGKLQKWLSGLAVGLEKIADYLSSDKFESDIRNFLDMLDEAAGVVFQFTKGMASLLSLIPGFGGKVLKGSEYKKLDEIEKISPEIAKELKYKLENPEAYKESQKDLITGKDIPTKLDLILTEFKKTPTGLSNSAKIDALIKSLDDNTSVTDKINDIDFGNDNYKSFQDSSKFNAIASAKAAQDKYGVPAEITLAQYQLESGGGKHLPPGSNNPFGIKAKEGQPFVEAETTENIGGKDIKVLQKFAKFDSIADAFDAHAKLLANSPAYAEARKHTDDPNAYADALTGKYATDPNYGLKLKTEIAKQSPETIAAIKASIPTNNVASNTTNNTVNNQVASSGGPRTLNSQSNIQQPVKVILQNQTGGDVFTTVNGTVAT